MTPEQYQNWKDFALRMARHAFPRATEARRIKIEKEVQDFFSNYDHNPEIVAKILDWDNSPTYVCDQVTQFLQNHDHYRLNHRTGEEVDHGNKFKNQFFQYF